MTTITLQTAAKYVTNEGTQTDPIPTKTALRCIAYNALQTAKQVAIQWVVPAVAVGAVAAAGVALAGAKTDSFKIAKNFSLGVLGLKVVATIASRYFPKTQA